MVSANKNPTRAANILGALSIFVRLRLNIFVV